MATFPNSNGLLTGKLFRAEPFTSGDTKILYAPTAFQPYNCREMREQWEGLTVFGTFTTQYEPPSAWPVPGTIVRRPRVVLFEHGWSNFWVDDETSQELRMDSWVALYNAVAANYASDDRITIMKGCSWIGNYAEYGSGLEGNSGGNWRFINADSQRVDRLVNWFLPADEDVIDQFVGTDVLSVVFFKNMGFTLDHYQSIEPSEYTDDIAAWKQTYDSFVGRGMILYVDDNGEYSGESGISGFEELSNDISILQTIASDLSSHGVTYGGTLPTSADLITAIDNHFGF